MYFQSGLVFLTFASSVLGLTAQDIYDKIKGRANGKAIVFYTMPAGGTDASDYARTIDGQTWDDFFEGDMEAQKAAWKKEASDADDLMSAALGMLAKGTSYVMVKDTDPAVTSTWVRKEYPELVKNSVSIKAVNAKKKPFKAYEVKDYTPHKNPFVTCTKKRSPKKKPNPVDTPTKTAGSGATKTAGATATATATGDGDACSTKRDDGYLDRRAEQRDRIEYDDDDFEDETY